MTDDGVKPQSRARVRIRTHNNDVGYGRPPKEHQFKPGQSGNPKGRKKGIKNEATLLRELLQQKVTLKERGRKRKITLQEALLRSLIDNGLKGNIKSTAFLLNRAQTLSVGEATQTEIGEDDKAVLKLYLEEFQSKNSSAPS